MKRVETALLVAALLSPSGSAFAADQSLDVLAEEVARLRSEIEALHARVEEHRDRRRTELRGLAVQKSTLEADIKREELRIQQLADRIGRIAERSQADQDRQQHLKKALLQVVARLRRTVEAGIPFAVTERSGELDTIGRELESGAALPGAAIDRLWSWIDLEMKLTKEFGVRQQSLVLEGEEVLADVAHVGMVALYFRAPGDRFGVARKVDGTWRWELTPLPEDRERIDALFAALERDVKSGLFELPDALVRGEVR